MKGKFFLTGSAAVLLIVAAAHAQESESSGAEVSAQSSTSADVRSEAGDTQQSSSIQMNFSARARMVDGRLGPNSRPNDQVVFQLEEGARSEAGVLLKKGSRVRGVVESVQRAEIRQDDGTVAERSVIHVRWEAFEGEDGSTGPATGSIRATMRSLTYVHPLAQREQASADAFDVSGPAVRSRAGSGVLGGLGTTAGGAVGTTTGIASGAAAAVDLDSPQALESLAAPAPSRPEAAVGGSILGATAVKGGAADSSQLFQLGQGAVVSPQGETQHMELFTRSWADSVITADTNGTAIGSGANALMLFHLSQ